MAYKDRIALLMTQIPATLVDMQAERVPARIPTQASSEFTTNREQGDWAENILLAAINKIAGNHVAVRYGMGDDRVAGEDGFRDFYETFQQELNDIGKRPDLLIFKKADLPTGWGTDISRLSRKELDPIVPKALAGLEVRSSAFLSKKYDEVMQAKRAHDTQRVLDMKQRIKTQYADLLQAPAHQSSASILDNITPETMRVTKFRCPPRRGSGRLKEFAQAFSDLKKMLDELKKRDHLSITPKVEDLRVVYQWVQKYNVPHFYVQVFFDKAHALSYEHILALLTDPDNEDTRYFPEGDVGNQKKMTIKINPQEGFVLAPAIDEPEHVSKRKELQRGQLLFYVTFKGGAAHLDPAALAALLQITPDEL